MKLIADEGIKCAKCNDDMLYTQTTLRYHKQAVHQIRKTVRVDQKPLCFTRNQANNLFPCACGKLLAYYMVEHHPSKCAACKKLAAKAKGNKPIDVASKSTPNKQDSPSESEVDDSSASHSKPSATADRKCDKCSDGMLYTAKTLVSHNTRAHRRTTVTTINNKKIRFTRQMESKLFPCACGKLLTYEAIRHHPFTCYACDRIVAEAEGDEPIDIAPTADTTQSAVSSCGNPVEDIGSSTSTARENEMSDMDIDDDVSSVTVVHADRPNLSDVCGDDGSVLLEPEELGLVQLAIHRKLKLVLCKLCKIAVVPEFVANHLQNGRHASILQHKNKDTIISALSFINDQKYLLSREQVNDWLASIIERQITGPALPQIPILPLIENGFKCSNCGYLTTSELSAKTHVGKSRCRIANATILTNIPLQRLGNGGRLKKPIHVDITPASKQQCPSPAMDINSDTAESIGGSTSTEPTQAVAGWLKDLQWDLLEEQLRDSERQDAIVAAISVAPLSSSVESWLIRQWVETIFEMEQQEIRARESIHRELGSHSRHGLDSGLDHLLMWRKGSSDDGKSKCILVAVRAVYGIIQLNRNQNHTGFLSQSDELRQAVLELSALVSNTVDNINSSDGDEVDLMSKINDEDYFTGMLYVVKVMKLLWVVKAKDKEPAITSHSAYRLLFLICRKEKEQLDAMEIRCVIDCFEYWIRITVDILLQLQLSAWKENADMKGKYHELDGSYAKLVTNLWWGVLDASQKGCNERQCYLEKAARKKVAKKRPVRIIERLHQYIEFNQYTPFCALQQAKDIISMNKESE